MVSDVNLTRSKIGHQVYESFPFPLHFPNTISPAELIFLKLQGSVAEDFLKLGLSSYYLSVCKIVSVYRIRKCLKAVLLFLAMSLSVLCVGI